jgi:abortive infection bacteriophage resistance protein
MTSKNKNKKSKSFITEIGRYRIPQFVLDDMEAGQKYDFVKEYRFGKVYKLTLTRVEEVKNE